MVAVLADPLPDDIETLRVSLRGVVAERDAARAGPRCRRTCRAPKW
jgi:hypothetical protein